MQMKWDAVNDSFICHELVKFETENPVAGLRFSGVHVWPALKLVLYRHLFHSRSNRLAFTSDYLSQTVHRMVFCDIAAIAKVKPDFLFFSMNFEYKKGIDGVFRNAFFDPLILNFSDRYSFSRIEFWSPETSLTQPRRLKSDFFTIQTVSRRLQYSKEMILGYERIAKAIQNKFGVLIDEGVVVQECLDIISYYMAFKEVIKIIQPRIVLYQSYYYAIGMGLAKACRERGVLSVDYQHGWQDLHPFYSHIAVAPQDGFDIIPDYFWVWNEYAYINIERWHTQNKSLSHQALIGGHPYFDTFYAEEAAEEAAPMSCQFINLTIQAKRVILVSLCPLEGAFPDNIYQAIERSPADWLWLIRQHPYYHHREGDIRQLLPSGKLAQIDVHFANTLPLPTLLAHSTHHLSPFSGTVAEALHSKVPSVLTHPRGKRFFRDIIKLGFATYAPRSDDILSAILSNAHSKRLQESAPFFPDNLVKAEEALATLLKRSASPEAVRQ